MKRLIRQGPNLEYLTDIYVKQIRSILELGVPVWNSGQTQDEVSVIEIVHKSFLHIVFGEDYAE